MVNPVVSFARTKNSEFIFFNAHKFKYYKFKGNEYINFILDEMSHGCSLADFNKSVEKNKLSVVEVEKYLSFLIGHDLIQHEEVPNSYNLEKIKLPELQDDSRYGYQLLYLKQRFSSLGISEEDLMKRIKNFRLCVVGAGAIGSFITAMAAAVGIGTIRMIDGDVVEASNITRQIFYKESDVNRAKKVDSMNSFVSSLNSQVKFDPVDHYVDVKNKDLSDFKDMDLVVQAADQPAGVIDEYIDFVGKSLKLPSLYVHNSTVGPFVVPGETKNYLEFEESIDQETDGLYTEFIHNVDSRSRTAYPTIVHGILPLASVLFDKVFEFAVTGDIPTLRNQIWLEKERKYKSF